MTDHLTYRGYTIDYDPPPVGTRRWDWSATHADYDGPGDPRHVRAASVKALHAEIDYIEDELEAADRAVISVADYPNSDAAYPSEVPQ